MGYNNTDGGSYVLIKDGPSPAASTAGAAARPMTATELEALFKTAAARNWTASQWVAASSSRSNASEWRRLITWPFGETSGVYQFNKKGDALYLATSLGRCVSGFERAGGC